MPADPIPLHSSLCYGAVQLLPQILIFNRFSSCCPPSIPFPVGHPLGNAITDILGIGIDGDCRSEVSGFETLNRGQ